MIMHCRAWRSEYTVAQATLIGLVGVEIRAVKLGKFVTLGQKQAKMAFRATYISTPTKPINTVRATLYSERQAL